MTTTTTPTSGAADLPAIISGALFDFAGFLTTLDKSRAATFSGAHEAGPAVTLLQEWSTKRGLNLDEADVSGWSSALTAQAISAEPAGATEMENLQRTAVGWQERALRAERNWVVCRRWAIAGGAPVEKLGDDPDQPFHAASPAIEGESNV